MAKNEYVLETKDIDGEQCVRASGGHTIDGGLLIQTEEGDENIDEERSTPSRHALVVEDTEVVTGGKENTKSS